MKWGNYLNRHFSKENMQMANNHMIKRHNITFIREIKIKTAMKCQFTSTRKAETKECVQDIKPSEFSTLLLEMENIVITLENCSAVSYNVKRTSSL